MASRGSALQRAVEYFRTANLDEMRVAFQLVKEIVEARLSHAKSSAKSQATAIDRPRKARRTKGQMAEDYAVKTQRTGDPQQTTIEEQHGSITV